MSISVKKFNLSEQTTKEEGNPINTNYLGLVEHIEVRCTIRIGTLNLTLGELRKLKTEQILTLEESTDTLIDIVLNEQVIARGELMSHDDCFAIRIKEVAS